MFLRIILVQENLHTSKLKTTALIYSSQVGFYTFAKHLHL